MVVNTTIFTVSVILEIKFVGGKKGGKKGDSAEG
jgi:hypothetical protein